MLSVSHYTQLRSGQDFSLRSRLTTFKRECYTSDAPRNFESPFSPNFHDAPTPGHSTPKGRFRLHQDYFHDGFRYNLCSNPPSLVLKPSLPSAYKNH
ncbi:hypothetical protein AVEN_49660-1 [Araneus ventricosus]|uniref:Uncharacterized protein n=1 Tax=Araneus ventricosus TaxID=182803 RepID=A0A4Y1ZXL5_ARAVE|nr:hypothetical protein AVEN_49660-1 [Araneus ventricosus]